MTAAPAAAAPAVELPMTLAEIDARLDWISGELPTIEPKGRLAAMRECDRLLDRRLDLREG